MNAHTPGPWTWGRTASTRFIKSALGNTIVVDNAANFAPEDATLMAAAPDLLAALERVQPFIESRALDGPAGNSVAEQMRDMLRAAITKARGQS